MRPIWINVIAIIIALSSLVMEGPTVQVDSLSESFQSVPLFESSALRNELSKATEKTVHIAQDFIPIVIIATFEHLTNNFLHYISIHSLVRQKEYFLLI